MTALPGKPAANAEQKTDSSVEPLVRASPGARLRKIRESLNLGVAEAAQSLNLSPGVVKALEADDYRTLPNATFVKGYMRSYARVLGIASEDLIRSYEAITGCDKPKPVIPIEAPKTGPNGGPILFAVIALLVAIAMIAFFVLTDDSPDHVEKPVQDPSASAISSTTGDGAFDGALDQASQAAGSSNSPNDSVSTVPAQGVGTEVEAGVEAVDSAAEPGVDQAEAETWIEEQTTFPEDTYQAPESLTSEPASSLQPHAVPFSEVAAGSSAQTAEVSSSAPAIDVVTGEISMTFTGDCWVEVRDATGELIYSNLKRLGETLTLEGQVPLEAKLGNGNMVSLSFNGKPVSFRVPPHNVVRVRLGD